MMDSAAPVITVLMPVYNGARFLHEAIRSVLAQSFRDFELLIIDDGSTDDSPRIAESFEDVRVRVVRNEANRGLVPALNRGLAEGRGVWIARQDADDLSEPGRLREQIEYVRGNPSVPLLGADATLINEKNRFAGRWRTAGDADGMRWDLCFRCPFCHSTAFFRKEFVLERFGGYHAMRACEDFDLWSRIARDFPVLSIRQVLVRYRIHPASIMGTEERSSSEEWNATRRSVIEANLAHFAPGLEKADRDTLGGPWSGKIPDNWSAYFRSLTEARRHYLRGRRPSASFNRLLADQCYMLLGRTASRPAKLAFLRALHEADRAIFLSLPPLRVLWSLWRSEQS